MQLVDPSEFSHNLGTLRTFLHGDVSQEYEFKKILSHQASHEDLTGLINHREFERRSKRLISVVQSEKVKHALCFMDLDQFKVVNDSCGHIVGDELLR